jgi:uncharacterized protein
MEEILSSIRRIIADEEADDASHDDDDLGAAEAHSEALNEDADALARAAEDDESDDVLELTKVVRESGEVVDLRAEDAAPMGRPADVPTDEPEVPIHDEVEMAPLEGASDDEPGVSIPNQPKQEDIAAVQMNPADARAELVSATAATAATGAFAKLSRAFQRTPPEESIADDSGRSVEQFLEDMIRPLLKEWLDGNLEPIVERLVQKEIQKIARRAELM